MRNGESPTEETTVIPRARPMLERRAPGSGSGAQGLPARRLRPQPEAPLPTREAPGTVMIDIGRLFAWLRAGSRVIFITALMGGVAGFAFASMTPPQFTASADILVEPVNRQVVPDDALQAAQRDSQLLTVDSKVRVLTSRNVLVRVVEALGLDRDPEFAPAAGNDGEPQAAAAGTPETARLRAASVLAKHITANREERSFVVTLSVRSRDAGKAVTISDAVIDAFQKELARADSESAGRTATSLTDRLAALRDDVSQAEREVEAFRSQHGLQMSGNDLLSAREMTDINSLKVAAEGRVIAARSRYEALTSAANDPGANAAALQSPTIAALRAQHAALMEEEGSRALVFGPRHPSRQALHAQLANVEQAITQETARLVESARAELQEAEANVASLTARAEAVQSTVAVDNAAEVRLRELQREAAAKASLYEAFLERARQAGELKEIDTTNIRVISSAVPPTDRSWPPSTAQVTVAGGISGSALGFVLAIAFGLRRDLRRRRVTA